VETRRARQKAIRARDRRIAQKSFLGKAFRFLSSRRFSLSRTMG
jgi:hypothetical protein